MSIDAALFDCEICGEPLGPEWERHNEICVCCVADLALDLVREKQEQGRKLKVADFPEALEIALRPDAGEWRKYQVSYPDASLGHLSVTHCPSENNTIVRVAQIMLEGAARDPGPGPYTSLVEEQDGDCFGWMSDTRVEIYEHMPLFRKLDRAPEGATVLINGLGLGMAALAAVRNPRIASVDVVELDDEVALLIGEQLLELADREHLDGGKVTVHVEDAHAIKWPRAKQWTYAWHDIWPNISYVQNSHSAARLMDKYERRVGWQGLWGKQLRP
jgi:hypothetical protein